MNAQIAKLGMGLLACYLALFATVNYVQVWRADDLDEAAFGCYEVRPSQRGPDTPLTPCSNTRDFVRDFDRNRGQILTADGVVIARSDPAPEGSQFRFQRTYPTGDLFAHTTGFLNFSFGAEGVERAFADDLSGESSELEYQSLSDLFVDRDRLGDVTLTLRADIQQLARDQLGEQRGSVVALDPRDGSILAMWSFPSYDPNLLSANDGTADEARAALEPDALSSPLIPAGYRRSFFPGSTFKVVTASIGVELGVVTPEDPVFPDAAEFDIDFTDNELSNFGGSTCGGALFAILAVSCNSAFAAMGADTIGQDAMAAGAERFGFNQRPPFDLPAPAASTFPTDFPDDQGNGPIARASIGQGDVSATPLQMALVAAAVANDGAIMAPHVLDRVTDDRGDTVRDHDDPDEWTRPMSPGAAATMREAMVGVVESGSGRAARIAGFVVGGKTGTAQLGTDPPSSHAWFIAFAGPPGETPEVAVAVLVEAQPGISEVTGGRVAAPIARAVMEAVLNLPD